MGTRWERNQVHCNLSNHTNFIFMVVLIKGSLGMIITQATSFQMNETGAFGVEIPPLPLVVDHPMIGKNRQLVTNGPVEFEK